MKYTEEIKFSNTGPRKDYLLSRSQYVDQLVAGYKTILPSQVLVASLQLTIVIT